VTYVVSIHGSNQWSHPGVPFNTADGQWVWTYQYVRDIAANGHEFTFLRPGAHAPPHTVPATPGHVDPGLPRPIRAAAADFLQHGSAPAATADEQRRRSHRGDRST